MTLRQIHLYNFKNFVHKKFVFAPVLTALAGPNGAGKTNILDAVHMLAFGKSYFHVPLSQIIRHGETEFSIKGVFEDPVEGRMEILLRYRKGEKRVMKRDGKIYERLADHIGLIPAVMISPYDRDLITEGGEIRRKFIDKIIAQFDKNYLNDLTAYHKFLAQRNGLLKYFAANGTFDAFTLDILDTKMDELAGRIHERRRLFVEQFRPYVQTKYRQISGGRETVDILYRSDLDERPLREWLESHLERDRLLQHTTKGIHRDDLVFLIDGYPIRRFGSQGQQKSFLIALKLAEYNILHSKMRRRPLLLFDDIFDKLDAGRVRRIVGLVKSGEFGQVFLSDTHPERLEDILMDFERGAQIIRL